MILEDISKHFECSMEYYGRCLQNHPPKSINIKYVTTHCMLTHYDPEVEKCTSYFTYRKLYERNSKIIIFHIISNINLINPIFIYIHMNFSFVQNFWVIMGFNGPVVKVKEIRIISNYRIIEAIVLLFTRSCQSL